MTGVVELGQYELTHGVIAGKPDSVVTELVA
jgi:hypothetical protein